MTNERPKNPHAWLLADLDAVRPNGFKVMSTFACGGGSSMGYKRAGFEVVAANDIDPEMQKHYVANLKPRHYFLCPIGDLSARDEGGAYKVALPDELADIDVLDGSPPCFPAGTPIMTARGLRPIEAVSTGDTVLTHRGEWRAVTETFVSEFKGSMVTVATKYGRQPVTATPNHPFLVRRRQKNRFGAKVYADPAWVHAGDLRVGDLLLEPRVWGAADLDLPEVTQRLSRGSRMHKRQNTAQYRSTALAWVLGLYIAEGHRRGHNPDVATEGPCRREVIFSIHQDEAAEVLQRLATAGYHGTVSKSVGKGVRVTVSSADLWALCAEFGDGATGKRLPAWAWCQSSAWLGELLAGYLYGDGHEQRGRNARGMTAGQVVAASTVSEDLGRGLLMLVARVHGVVPSLAIVPPRAGVIDGRNVSCKQVWVVRFNRPGCSDRARPGFVDEMGAWLPVSSVTVAEKATTTVYNFGVDGHHTYVAGGLAVHNCSTFSPAGDREKAWGKSKKFREGQAKQVLSDLFFDYLDLVARLRPKVSIAENVQGMLLGNAKGYVKRVFARYRELGYRPQLFLVNAADCGVPQARRRVFFVAVRADLVEAHALPPLAFEPRAAYVSCADACADVQDLTAEEAEDTAPCDTDRRWWSLTRPGENYASAVARAGLPNSLWNWIRHPAHRPACTLVATHACMKHWSVCRSLTLREFKRLGSFPDDYWCESFDRGKYMIGMSVPPKMTEAVARAVAEQWLQPAAAGARKAARKRP